MKKIILTILTPFFCFLSLELQRLRKYCTAGCTNISVAMQQLSFFTPVANNPSIIFGIAVEQNKGENIPLWMSFSLVAFLKLSIILGFFNNRQGRSVALKGCVHPDFATNMRRLLHGVGNNYIEYQLPKENIDNLSSKRICIYSALFGDYDQIHEPVLFHHPNVTVDYIMFSNNPSLKTSNWQIRQLHDNCSNAILSRKVRMFPHLLLPDYDICIYVDASVFIYGDIAQLSLIINDRTTFAVTKHAARSSVHEEIFAFATKMNIDKEIAQKQYNIYIANGFKDDIHLTENGLFIVRNNDPETMELMESWFDGYRNCLLPSDQLPLQPTMSKLKFSKYKLLDGSVWCNQFLMVLPHKKNTTH